MRNCFIVILWPNWWWLLRGVLAGKLLGLRAAKLLIRLLLLLSTLTTACGIVRCVVGHRVVHLLAQVVPLSLLVLKHLLDGLGDICFIVARCCDSRAAFASSRRLILLIVVIMLTRRLMLLLL